MTDIFLVEDDAAIQSVLEMLLTDEGFTVTSYHAAEAALAGLALTVPDALILDGQLPRMSGWECLGLLRAQEPTGKLPVLMLTGAVDKIERAQRRRADDCTTYVAKPFDIDEVLAAIHGVIQSCGQPAVAVVPADF